MSETNKSHVHTILSAAMALNYEEWDRTAPDQIERLINIYDSNENFFVANGNDYSAYKGDAVYGDQNGVLYQLNKKAFEASVEYCLEEWRIPTVQGFEVDLWLL